MVDIATERLTLRCFGLDDAPFVLRLLNEPSFIENIADKGVRDLEGARRYLRDGPMASYARFGFGLWRVGFRSDDTPIGMAGLLKRDYLDDVDIGYALLPEHCGSGYALEAACAAMRYAREQLTLQRVLAIVNDDNGASIRLLRKLGFESAGARQLPDTNEQVQLFASDGRVQRLQSLQSST